MVPLAREAPLAVKPPAASAAAKTLLASTPSPGSNLTPPLTPVDEEDGAQIIPVLDGAHSKVPPLWAAQLDGPSECSLPLKYRYGQDGSRIEYGRGAWSNVYSAISIDHAAFLATSPPQTPTRGSSASSPLLGPRNSRTSSYSGGGGSTHTTVYAVKVASGRLAHDAVSAEADILTLLHRIPGSAAHIVPFHGYIASEHAIVMTAIPLSFASYIKTRAKDAAAVFNTRTMFKPVLGMATWLSFADKLVEGLQWMHEAGVVHGDIKPQNILLRPRVPSISSISSSSRGPTTTALNSSGTIDDTAANSFDLLFIDFTSSLYSHDSSVALNSTASSRLATSLPFTAPELLSISSITVPPTPAPSSDIFALALTLVAAAIGYGEVYPGLERHRALALARDGHRVIDYVRAGEQGTRVPRKGVVERVISPAVLKDADSRVTTEHWLGIIRGEIAALA
ncbi:serine/threonine protein kinase [Trichophyton rubrum MR1459]|uniref:Serine/threonine protein kinase n=5 Tax=Trichophyton TaxID=5550 RepID=A0A178F5E7_TRIRU|nr:serine/threonine protein kinase [Trichophyton rubrum CBS 118892]EZF25330.1 serine/threonine protein kinase [Trichophyton rubrum MR850]EZF44394.1 serine/threonine protein kinase [Trichophyton rubrum CBS 100081]EZF55014.1 serine/threonine protein kinase [Trichophyton rubrum CBS 288.86]EZF65674.1 serine/threonine protein kinase [Trichophyton rubrum CBS 289.86]EZF76268.1 serine/threonine protein kinase [Trichophyton soudanense CBS 452.61]EZF86956.1 serine/threonine protein kinase [Trichophyton